MGQTRLPAQRSVLLAACAAAWLAVTGDLLDGATGDHVDLLAIIAGTLTVVTVIALSRRRVERVFTHGYHAGFHDASRADCCGPGECCDVLVLSEERAKRAL